MSEPGRDRLWTLFDKAADLPPMEQQALLEAACADDPQLRAEVEQMLASDARLGAAEASAFLKSPLIRSTAELPVGAAPSPPTDTPPLPSHLGRYRLIRLLGEGGMGAVYEAEQDSPHRTVALKVVRPGLASGELLKRFRHESQILGRLHHPGIAQVYEAGLADDSQPFFAMEFIRGLPLDEYARLRAPTLTARLELLARVCDAVQHAHEQGVIHRDLKPANILVEETGQPKVLDFGVARATDADLLTGAGLTRTGQLLGTLNYMSPEQVTGDPAAIDHRADVYALGVILFELAAHRLPYRLENRPLAEAARLILEEDPPRLGSVNPELRGDVETIVAKALEKDPARRYASSAELAADIRRHLGNEPIRAKPPTTIYLLRKFVRRNKTLVGGVAGVIFALVVGLIGTLSFAIREAEQRGRAEDNAGRAATHARQADAKNRELTDEQAKVEKRFELALRAIALFHTGVSEDMLLKNAEFKELRTKLLKEAAGFYADLEKLLAGQTDAKSRKALAAAYYQLADLRDMIGDKTEALAVYRKALALRRELAAAEGADEETWLSVARSLEKVGWLLSQTGDGMSKLTGDYVGALGVFEEQRELAERLEAEHSTDAVQSSVASSLHNIAWVLYAMGKPEESLASNRKAVGIRQKLADANPADNGFQSDLAKSHNHIAIVLSQTGKPEEALSSWRKASAIWQKLADANPAVTQFQSDLAVSHFNIGIVLRDTGKPEEALASWRKALAIEQKLADANPAVTRFQSALALNHNLIGLVLTDTGKPEEALKYLEERLQLLKAKHGPDHPATLVALDGVANGYLVVATKQAWLGQEQEWAATCERGLSLAGDTKIVTLADKVAKMCSLRLSNDKTRRAALLLARRAVELGKDNQYLANFQMALGMAEYRSGHFAEADAALLSAMEAGKVEPDIAGTSAFYRALSLFHQGRPDEARQLATQAAAKMKPLPKDAKNPLAGGGNHDTLILWLAYREAKDAIKFDEKNGANAEPETQNKAKPKDGSQ